MINKVIEVQTQSGISWEDAAQKAVDEASHSVHNIRSVYIKDMSAKVEKNKITAFRVNAKITFEIEKQPAA
jgi:flavin-binding protein dodecin